MKRVYLYVALRRFKGKNILENHFQKQIFIVSIYKWVKIGTKNYWNLISIIRQSYMHYHLPIYISK